MDLLPSSHKEFSQPDYWDRFFKKRGKTPFEWYGDYPQLSHVIHKYITPANQVLVVGCGNSALSEHMYDNGLQNLSNIDISDIVVRQMTERHKVKRPKMTFAKVDVTQMPYADGHFNAVLDKGTLDALLVSEEADVVDNVIKMFVEVSRCLHLGGRYIIISLLQEHVQKTLLKHFTDLKWPVRIHRIVTENSTEGRPDKLAMPVFAVVLTKLKSMPGMPQIVEVCRHEDKVDRLEDVKFLSEIVRDMQYFNLVQQQLSKPCENQLTLDLHTADTDTPRYRLTVVDSPGKMDGQFGIFIVPQGRETEWLFSSDKGRLQLAASAGFQRLVVATLGRGHTYEGMEAIKADLSLKVMEMAPAKCPPREQVPFLSIGEDLGRRHTVAQGLSASSGYYLVEDVELNGGQIFRRLFFLDTQNVIQSEARMSRPERKKAKASRRNKKAENKEEGHKEEEHCLEGLKVDQGYVASDYIIAVVGGLAFLPQNNDLSCVLVGLGGGGLVSFMLEGWPNVSMEAVELDPMVVDVAKKYFDLDTESKRLEVRVEDGLGFIRGLANCGAKKDMIIIDVDSKDQSVGLSCPPPAFVETDFLQAISSVLGQDGLLVLNLAARDEDIGAAVVKRIGDNFTSCAVIKLEEDVNTIVFAANCSASSETWRKENLEAMWKTMDARVTSVWPDTNVDISDMMEALTIQGISGINGILESEILSG